MIKKFARWIIRETLDELNSHQRQLKDFLFILIESIGDGHITKTEADRIKQEAIKLLKDLFGIEYK